MGCRCSTSKKGQVVQPNIYQKKEHVVTLEATDNADLIVAMFLSDVYKNVKYRLSV